jgi:hypothetical protein
MKFLWQATCLSIILLFSGCASSGPSSAGSTEKYFETFFVGEEGMQYFIKPLEFDESEGEGSLEIDLLFRYKNEIKDSSTINLSIISEDIIKDIDSLVLSNGVSSTISDQVNLMFNEKKKRLFYSRFSCKVPFKDVVALFENTSNWQVAIHSKGVMRSYSATKKTTKTIGQLNANVFVLFR